MKIFNSQIGLFLSLTSTVILVACGGSSSNPLDKYKDLKETPATETKSISQTVLKPDLFLIEAAGTNEANMGNFVEGQASEMLIKVSPKSNLITKYVVEMTDFSNIERPTLTQTADNQVYSLKWLAPVGTIPSGKWGKTFQAQIQVTVLEASNSLLVGTATSKTLDIIVSRNNAQPKITGRTDLSKGVDEGQNVSFTVDMVDPGSTANLRLPEIQITPYVSANTEAYCADGSHYLVFDDRRANNPEKLSDGSFRFYYNLQIDNLPLDRDRQGKDVPAATDVAVCFQMRAVSSVGTLSDQFQVRTQARYAAQPPALSIVDASGQAIPDAGLEVKPGVETVLNIKMSVQHVLSVLNIAKPELLIAGLSGKKEIACAFDAADKKNSETCVIKWTPACVSKTASTTLTVKADATLGTKTKSSSISKALTVVPDLVACPVNKAVGGK